MSEPKFTKGPWMAGQPSSVVGWPVVSMGAGGRLICDVVFIPRRKDDPATQGDKAFNAESKANAALIGAAPDLYDAAEKVLGYLSALIDEAPANAKPVFFGIAELHAAVAKARGGS